MYALHDLYMNYHQSSFLWNRHSVKFTSNKKFTRSWADFFANYENKQRFVQGLVEYLTNKGVNAVQSQYGDVDAEVVKAAVTLSSSKPKVCVGKDSDLLVLLLSQEG